MKNLNADFLLDIWADLKAKKLAPIAIGLVAAVVAMPALMLKGGGCPGRRATGPVPVIAAAAAGHRQGRARRGARRGRLEARLLQGARPVRRAREAAERRRRRRHRRGDRAGRHARQGLGDDGATLPSLGSGGGSTPDSPAARPTRAPARPASLAVRRPAVDRQEARLEVHVPARRQVRPRPAARSATRASRG